MQENLTILIQGSEVIKHKINEICKKNYLRNK